jgi:hypothetical protein
MENDRAFRDKIFNTLQRLEVCRKNALNKDNFNLMTRACYYEVDQTLESIKGQMSRRLKFCEEEFIVGLHWKLREILISKQLEEAKNFLPGCDKIKKCDYSSADYLSNMFGCLFAGCNRWKDESNYASFNKSCSDRTELEEQLQIKIPKSDYELSL